MNIIKVAYMPDLSKKAIELITEHVSYSMISQDESSQQYEITQCIDIVKEYDCYDDIETLEELEEEGVSFIEL